ncbi:PREDICTED: uncharacterized protein LOC104818552, partial [Tarenaya hassleriana]|uniref:uncharacterized protein LOC104818552 n=1 Tax=Tarenaya hassleriana TaxID=28532 RepID=UPI00053C679D
MNLIKGIDEDAWSSVEEGWSAPIDVKDGKEVLKPRSEWTPSEKRASALNSKAITIIFNIVDKDEFKQIQGCKSAKEAWDALELIHEGTSSVKRTRRDLIKHQFNMLQMGENESVKEFCGRLNALANEAGVLGKTYRDKQLVAKLLVSLPKKFMSHKSAFTMVNNVDTISFKETVGAFVAHELELELYEKPKGGIPNKGLALHVPESSEAPSQVSLEEDGDDCENIQPVFLKKKPSITGKAESRNSGKCLECQGAGHWKAECPSITKREAMLKNLKDLQCYECKGYGHTKNECAIRKTRGKSLITHEEIDTDYDEESGEEMSNFVAFIGIIEETEEEISEEDLYKDMSRALQPTNTRLIKEQKKKEAKILEIKKQLDTKVSEVDNLKKQLKEKEEKIILLQNQLEGSMKNVRMLGNGTAKLDHLLTIGRTDSGHTGLGYTGGSKNKVGNFVSGGKLGDEVISQVQQTPKIKIDLYPRKDRRTIVSIALVSTVEQEVPPTLRWRQVWRRKDVSRCNVAYTSELKSSEQWWYFDSGCSHHMTGDVSMLSTFEENLKGGNVTFGDGRKGKILDKGNLDASGLPKLTDVNAVQGLKANLISISQLCDFGFQVNFTKDACVVTNFLGDCVLTGKRTPSNCYTWVNPDESTQSEKCFTAADSELELWHQRLGHINTMSLVKLSRSNVVRGLPELSSQTESLGGKRFLREKSETLGVFEHLWLQLRNGKGSVQRIQSDHGREFENEQFAEFCNKYGIVHEYSAPKTPQQNGVVEKKNRTLQEMARTMLHARNVTKRFWAEA